MFPEEFTEAEDMMASYKEHFYKEFPEEYNKDDS
jgi:hypothetical protein